MFLLFLVSFFILILIILIILIDLKRKGHTHINGLTEFKHVWANYKIWKKKKQDYFWVILSKLEKAASKESNQRLYHLLVTIYEILKETWEWWKSWKKK